MVRSDGMAVWRELLCVALLVLLHCASAFYLPGLAPTNFCRKEVKDLSKANCKVGGKLVWKRFLRLVSSVFLCPQLKVFVHVNKLDSVETVVPYEYSR